MVLSPDQGDDYNVPLLGKKEKSILLKIKILKKST